MNVLGYSCVNLGLRAYFLEFLSPKEHMADNKDPLFKPSESMRDLQFLEELEKTPNLSQRELSNKFGIALGVTNACLKRMARRGWIRLGKIPPRRIGYFLTPKGFAEKAKLTMTFLSYNIHHYSRLKAMIGEKFLEMVSQGVNRVIFYGVSEEMEVAYVTLQGTGMELVAIVDDNDGVKGKNILGRKAQDPGEIGRLEADAILITSIQDRDRILKSLKKKKNKVRLFTIS
jgi:DNA-binding MarR family transcriptional regulator